MQSLLQVRRFRHIAQASTAKVTNGEKSHHNRSLQVQQAIESAELRDPITTTGVGCHASSEQTLPSARDPMSPEGQLSNQTILVSWDDSSHDMNPRNWSSFKRAGCTLLVAAVCFVCMCASSIDAAIAPQAAKEFGVSAVVESMATGNVSPW